MTSIRRSMMRAAALGALVLSIGLVYSSGASAAQPWWHVDTISAPASRPGGEGRLVVDVSNLGDAPVDGFGDPVQITDVLPAGVLPTHVYGEGGGSFPVGINGVKTLMTCKLSGQTVACSYEGPLFSYEMFMIAITVQVEPGAGMGVSEVSVSGGGANPAVWRHALALGDMPGPFGAENYELTAEEEGGEPDTQAGSHPFQLTTSFAFDTKAAPVKGEHGEILPEVQPVALAKELHFVLPRGLVGNPTPLPKCKLSVFVKEPTQCPNDTVIGVATPIITNLFGDTFVPFAETYPLYSVEPSVGEPARFGFPTQLGSIVLNTAVRTGQGYSVEVSVPDIPSDTGFIGAQTTFWGVPADSRHDTARGTCLDQWEGKNITSIERWEIPCSLEEKPQPFLIMPTSCTGPLHSQVSGEAWDAPGVLSAPLGYISSSLAGEPIGQDGCDRLSFEPSITLTPDGQQASTPTGLTVQVHVDQQAGLNPTGLAASTVRSTTVKLPAGVLLDPSGADGLQACSLTQIALDSPAEQTCPDAAKIGTVEIETPLLPNMLKGAAYLATPAPFGELGNNPFNSLLAIYLVARDPVSGVLVKLAGQTVSCEYAGQLVAGGSCEAPGQLISTFKDTPQLPFENLRLNFFGGSRAPLGTPAFCGAYTSGAQIAPWSGNAAARLASPPFEITSGPNGAACPSGSLPFGPELTSGSTNLQAGAFTPFTMTMSRPDGNQNLDAISLHMPAGLSGLLTGVKLCGEADANAGTCGAESEIGETIVSVGLGGDPYTVTGGKVYITEKYDGAPFGLSIVNPADAGPFHLGKVIVRARIEVDPITAALTVSSDTTGPHVIPQFIKGIPLQIKHVNVTINRPGFTFNPTDCEKTAITGSLTSSEKATSALSVPFQVTNCATLGFKPSFHVTTSAHTSRTQGASLDTVVTTPAGSFGKESNIKSVKVDLPYQLPSRLTTLQEACTDKQFEANPAGCPGPSRVGTATVHTPLLPVLLTGPAYFVSHGAAKFPELIVVLQGYGVTIELHGETFISKTGITSTTFHAVPDAPFESFELSLPQGPYSALTNNGSLCNAKQLVTTGTKRVKRRVKGRIKYVKVKTHKTIKGLLMPTALTGQNGAVIHETNVIRVLGCPKARKATRRHKKRKHGKRG